MIQGVDHLPVATATAAKSRPNYKPQKKLWAKHRKVAFKLNVRRNK
jgi:hypothetical protein